LRNNDLPLKRMVKNIYDDIRKNHPSFTYVDEEGRLVLTEPEEPNILSSNTIVTSKAKRKLLVVVVLSCMIGLFSLGWLIKKNLSDDGYIVPPISGVLTKKFSNRAEQQLFMLSDSSKIWLNSASSLEFPDHFDDDKREAILSGEGFFTVHNSQPSPFLIYVGNIIITAPAGTSLNVKAYQDEQYIKVAVNDGKVIVKRNNHLLPTIEQGRIMIINKSDGTIAQKKIPLYSIAAWQQGNMIYEKEKLIDVLADFKRVYNVDILLSDAGLENREMTFSFKRDIGVKEALALICRLTDSELDEGEANKFIIL